MAVWSSLFGRKEVAPAVPAQVISATELPPELRPYYKDILTKAQALYQDRTAEGYKPYQGPTIAEFTPEQQQVQTGIAGLVGSGEPIYQEALGMTREAATPYTTEQIESYMSPYQQAVTDIEKREATKQFESEVIPKLAEQAVQAQAFGGSRQAILEGMAADTQQRLLSDIQAKGSQQAYQDAIARLDADRLAKGQGATDLANLGAARFKQATTELSGLQAIGQEKQTQTQTALDEAFKQYLDEQQFPYDTMAKYQSVVTGAPIQPMQYIPPQPAQYTPSLGQQLVGGLGGLGNLYGSFTGKTLSGATLPGYTQGAGKTGGGISSLVKRANGSTIGNPLTIDESLLEEFPKIPQQNNLAFNPRQDYLMNYINMLNKYGSRIKQFDTKQGEISKLKMDQLKKEQELLEGQNIRDQFEREQALFKAMASVPTDQDITEAPGGGVGQFLTTLSKVGPQVGDASSEIRAKSLAEQRAVADLEIKYKEAINAGDMTTASLLLDQMKNFGTTYAAVETAKRSGTPTYKAAMDPEKFSELGKSLFSEKRDATTNTYILPDQYQKEYNNLMAGWANFGTKLMNNPTVTLNIGGKDITIDVAADLLGQKRGTKTLNDENISFEPLKANQIYTTLMMVLASKLGFDNITGSLSKDNRDEWEKDIEGIEGGGVSGDWT